MVFALGMGFNNNVDAKKVTNVSYSYHSNKKIRAKYVVIKDSKTERLYQRKAYYFDAKSGKTTGGIATDFDSKSKPRVVKFYGFNGKKYILRAINYHYNIHSKSKTTTKEVFARATYNKKGKYTGMVYKSKTAIQDALAKVALKQVGDKYRAGGKGPNAFDCSGLTSYVYKQVTGKKIGSSSYAQNKKGKYVKLSTKTLKKGDLLFWGSKKSPYHVGIYVGNGYYVHAQSPGAGVTKKKLSFFTPSYAKRLI